MAQPYAEYVDVEVSKRAGDEVASSNTDGNVFTKGERAKAWNSARKDIYHGALEMLGLKGFKELYPEFIKISATIARTVITAGCALMNPDALNTYTNSTKTIHGEAAEFTTGITDFDTGADFVGALVIMVDNNSSPVPFITKVESVTNGTDVVLADAYGGNIAGGDMTAIIVIDEDSYFARPANCKKVLNVWTIPGEQNVPELDPELYGESIGDDYSSFAGSVTAPKFVDMDKGVRLLPSDLSASVKFNMLIQPVDVTLGAGLPDMQEPESWKELIIQKAAEILLSSVQIV